MKKPVFVFAAMLAGCVFAQGKADARVAYQERQALAEVPRLVQQFDQLQASQESLSARLSRIESSGRANDVKAEVAALRAELGELKRRQDALRGDVVKDLMQKLEPLLAKQNERLAAQDARIASIDRKGGARSSRDGSTAVAAAPVSPTGKVYNHVVEPGQTLSEIARGYGVTVARVLEFNPGLKPERLKVGQTVVVPEK